MRRKLNNLPTLRMKVPGNRNSETVADSLGKILGKRPTKVSEIHEGEFEIIFPDISAYEKVKSFPGKEFDDSNVLVQIQEIEPVLTTEDIFNLVKTKLALRNKHDALQSSVSSPGYQGFRRSRSVGVENRGGKQPRSRKSSSGSTISRATTPPPSGDKSQTSETRKSDQPTPLLSSAEKSSNIFPGAALAENKNTPNAQTPRLGGTRWITAPSHLHEAISYNGQPPWHGNNFHQNGKGNQWKGGKNSQWNGTFQQNFKGKGGKGKGKGFEQNFGTKGGRGNVGQNMAPPIHL